MKIQIDIRGPAGSGKSQVANTIYNILDDYYSVRLIEEGRVQKSAIKEHGKLVIDIVTKQDSSVV